MPIFLAAFTICTFSLLAIEAALHLSLFTGFRQISIFAVFLIIWIYKRGNRTVPINYIFTTLALTAILLTGAIISNVPTKNLAIGTFMTIEFAAIFYLASSTKVSPQQIERFSKVFLAFLLINALGALFSYIEKFPEAMRQDVGVQGDAGFFASALNIGTILLLGMSLRQRRGLYIFLAALFSIIIFLTVIKKAIIINIIIWLIWTKVANNKNNLKQILPIVGILGLASILGIGALQTNLEENVSYLRTVGLEEHVRFIMYSASIQIAFDHFPLGSGAGSFGSLASISGYFSPLHDLYGATISPTNSREAVESGSHTLLDTYWPHVIAESGFIGTAMMAHLFLTPIKNSIKAFNMENLPVEIKFSAFAALCIPVSLLLEGFALYTTEAPSFIIFLGGISGYCFRLTRISIRQSMQAARNRP